MSAHCDIIPDIHGHSVKLRDPEERLPEGRSFVDESGHVRQQVRIAWWLSGARAWREAAISLPGPSVLPDTPLRPEVVADVHPADEKPVFFGHYWLNGDPRIDTANALCLDYSAGIGDDPVTACSWRPDLPGLLSEAIVGGRERTTAAGAGAG